MIVKPLEKITFSDLEAFVQEQWPEGKTVDYKRDAYGGRDEDKKELLKDVSSFANTHGGDILIGVDEDKGIPSGIPGFTVPDIDKEKLRLEGIIRQGLEPRVEFGIHHVSTPSATFVLIIRVKESLLFPHRVVFQGKFGEFWARSSAGKFSMDTDELRRAFTLSDSIYEQIKSFRQKRIAQIESGDTPVPLTKGAKLILHFIPVASFRSRQAFDVGSILESRFPPMTASGGEGRLNLDGHVTFAQEREATECWAYTQFFRNGIVEAVLSDIESNDPQQGKLLLSTRYEWRLVCQYRPVSRILTGLHEMGIEPPVWCFMTLTGVRGASITSASVCAEPHRRIDRDILMLPEGIIGDLKTDAIKILQPMFDLVWNASGYVRSFNFDSDGKWVGKLN